MASWKTTLDPWARRWWDFQRDLDTYCRECDDDELTAFERAAYGPTSTNCWFATYEVAPMVRDAVHREQTRRKQLAALSAASAPTDATDEEVAGA